MNAKNSTMPFNQQIARITLNTIILTAVSSSPLWAADSEVPKSPCDRTVADLQLKAPGTLTGYKDITPTEENFPKNAQAWRIQYVSTGRDNNQRTLVCGVIIAPKQAMNISMHLSADKNVGRIVAWSHGTLGTIPSCQPSFEPESYVWKETPYGIGAVALGEAKGKSSNGILSGMIDEGLIVAASDYYVDLAGKKSMMPYAIGKIEAANVIDSVRAVHQLLTTKDAYPGSYQLNAYDVVTWGHSQGGHAAMWAAQLLPSYIAATAKHDDPTIKLSGVAIEAGPPTLTAPRRVLSSFSDLDWLTHAELPLTGASNTVVAMPYFFSYLSKSWSQNSEAGPASASAMPAYPNVGKLDPASVIMHGPLKKDKTGENVVDKINHYCWTAAGLEKIIPLTNQYKTEAFTVNDIADGPTIDGVQHGNLDRICAGNPPPGIAQWCSWLTYNNLGPLGTSNLDKLPKRDNQLAPVYIAQGSQDQVVHCVAPASASDQLPSAENCQSSTLYDALRPEYCASDTGDKGYLELNIWKGEQNIEASHSNITGLVAAASTSDLSYRGSRLQRFITSAFDGTLKPGCSASVVNASVPPKN
jgi:pimeloyl-ACP methyl ester carboxylesterase